MSQNRLDQIQAPSAMSAQDSKRPENAEATATEERPTKRARVEREEEDTEDEEELQNSRLAPAQASDLYLDTVNILLIFIQSL